MVVIRGRREGVFGFGREATSAHDIDFSGVVVGVIGVVGGVASGVIGGVGKVAGAEEVGVSVGAEGGEGEIGDTGAGGAAGGEAGGAANATAGGFSFVGFLVWWSRTWSCSLVLLGNFAGQRLHACFLANINASWCFFSHSHSGEFFKCSSYGSSLFSHSHRDQVQVWQMTESGAVAVGAYLNPASIIA